MTTDWVSFFVPNPPGAVWIGLLVTFVVLGDFRRPVSSRNRALLGLLVVAPLLMHVFGFNDMPRAAALVFTGIFAVTAAYVAWSLTLAIRASALTWAPNLPLPALRWLALLLIMLGSTVVVGRLPNDAGIYSNLGAQRWRETGTLPYADPLLKGPDSPAHGAAATYGPVLYLAHVPFQIAFGAPSNPPDANPMDPSYRWPGAAATKAACFTFFLVALVSLYSVVRRLAGEHLALAAVVLFAGSPYTIGLGGNQASITGLTYISHVAPSAVMLAALALLHRPAVAGSLLALSAGTVYFPAFVFPVWLGWFGANRAGALRFGLGFAATAGLLVALVVWFTHSADFASAVRLFLESTLEHQEGVVGSAYGSSTFSFWGTHPRLAAFWQTPVFGSTSLFKPTFLVYLGLVGITTCIAWFRRSSVRQLAGMTAALAAGVQLWKTHATGSYVEWYYPFLVIALVGTAHTGGSMESESRIS